MPEEYKGKYLKEVVSSDGKLIRPSARQWTDKEIEWVMDKVEKGYSSYLIADKIDRGRHSVALKIKRLKKKNGEYNEKHKEEKYKSNKDFYDFLQPKTVLDCFCGTGQYWKTLLGDERVTDNDIVKTINSDYNLKASVLLDMLEGEKFDLVDIDPFGGAYDYIDKAYNIADKGLIITFGEMGHLRWKRLDYVEPRYGISKIEDFTSKNLVKHILNKYDDLRLYKLNDYQNISRAYFIKV